MTYENVFEVLFLLSTLVSYYFYVLRGLHFIVIYLYFTVLSCDPQTPQLHSLSLYVTVTGRS